MDIITNNTEIAILLGVYNAEKYLEEQLISVINQTYRDWTLYIRDDASSDKTKDIIKKYTEQYSNIIEIVDKDGNLGCNGNYFRLLSLIKSKYYMFCNADDFWYDKKIQLSIQRIKKEEIKNPHIPIIVHSDLSIGDKDLNILENSYWETVNVNPEKFKSFNLIGICNIVAGATMIFNEKTKQVTFPISKFAPFFDHWMALQVIKANGIISTIHNPTLIYRQIGTNLAAVSIGKTNTLKYKILTLKKVLKKNKKEMNMLKKVRWGGTWKYIYIKMLVLIKLRFSSKYLTDINANSITNKFTN